MISAFVMASGGIAASRIMYTNLVKQLLRTPMYIYDCTPMGRLLNLVSQEISIIDYVMPFTIRSIINTVLLTGASLFTVGYTTPMWLILVAPLAVVYYFIQVTTTLKCFLHLRTAASINPLSHPRDSSRLKTNH